MKKYFRTQSGRFIAGLVAFLIVVGVTVGARQLGFMKVDVTAQKLMTMSAQSREIARGIEKDVVIYQLAAESDKDQWTSELAKQYAAQNSCITYELIDPSSVKAQKLAAQLGAEIELNSLVVSSGNRTVLIASSDMYLSVYNQEMMRYGQYVLESQNYAADEEIANALLYVTREDLPVMYALTGHGEEAVGPLAMSILREKNIALENLSLADEVPEDAAVLLIQGMTSDLTDQETSAILSYLKDGGRMILMTGFEAEGLKNLETVTAYYGMQPVESTGVVLDPAAGYSYSAEYLQYLKPDIKDHVITGRMVDAGAKATLGLSGAMERGSIQRADLKVTELMTTSDSAYMKSMQSTSLEKDEGDTEGPFTLAMTASEGDTRMVWYASGSAFQDNEIAISNGMNIYLMQGTLDWLVEGSDQVDIGQVVLSSTPVSVPANMKVVVYGVLFVPALAALVIGMIRKRGRKA